jgi:hypothetical protein
LNRFQVVIRTPGLVPVLALLPKTVANVALAHGLILHVHELCAKVSGMTGLPEAGSYNRFSRLQENFDPTGQVRA